MSGNVTVPMPSSKAAELRSTLKRALDAFNEARSRRDEAETRVRSARFELKELTDEPPPINNIRRLAEREESIARAKARVDEALAEFLTAQKGVEQAAVETTRADKAAAKTEQTELGPTREKVVKAFEASAAETMALYHLAAALNEVLGTGRFDARATILHPLN
jgi:DNA repair ATPase RecN